MSEYQYVVFHAIDRPVPDTNMKYMRAQSSRAQISPRRFENEYNFGDFHGDPAGMLQRGYDFHLHFADFGIRRLMIHIAAPLPDPAAAKAYWIKDVVKFSKDKSAPGGILYISPFYEPGDIENPDDIREMADQLLPFRAELIDGDLRPLYIANLASKMDCGDDTEGPTPAGLAKLTPAQQSLVEFLGLPPELMKAAAKGSAPAPEGPKCTDLTDWLSAQPEAKRNIWLASLLTDRDSKVRQDILTTFRNSIH